MIDEQPNPLPRGARLLARILDVMALAALAAIPVIAAVIWFLLPDGTVPFREIGIELGAWLGPLERAGGFAILMIPGLLSMYSLWRLHGFFSACLRDRPFSADALRGFRAFALVSLVLAFGQPFIGAGLSAYLSALSPDHESMVMVGFSSENLNAIFIALVFFLISHLMVTARALNEEASAFI
ncbi:hypothetical protein FKB34_15810 [Glycocaulis profundi]|nr:hypothetical protein FKB34_15810 [Glycocaulis profundi]